MNSPYKQQQGVALIVSLMILVLVTVAGVATMESTAMQLKMSNASNDRQQAFEAAEAALRMVEERVELNIDSLAEHASMVYECSGDECFTADCTNGRCFQGVWLSGDDVTYCKTYDDGSYSGDSSSNHGRGGGTSTVYVEPPTTSPWEIGSSSDYLNVWDSDDQYATIALDSFDKPVKYIVEFRCFTPADPVAELSSTNYAQIFRMTTRAMSDSGRSEVMLQSTYKRNH